MRDLTSKIAEHPRTKRNLTAERKLTVIVGIEVTNMDDLASQQTQRQWTSLDPVVLADQSGAWRWLYDPDGEGIAVARSATLNFDKIHGQIAAFEALHLRGRKIREIVACVGVDGHRRFHERPDLVAVEAAVLADPRWCSFVAFAEATRVSRSIEGALQFSGFLADNDVELVLLDQGDGPADMDAMEVALWPSMVAAADRADMLARMRAGKLARKRAS